MNHIKKFNQFTPINEEESWLKKGLTGLALLLSIWSGKAATDSESYDKGKDKKMHLKVKDDKSMERLVKRGWTLDSTQVDTLMQTVIINHPDTIIIQDEVSLQDNVQGFDSGKFILSNRIAGSINNYLKSIEEQGGILTDVNIESSTDKQRLRPNGTAWNNLKDSGYSTDNAGLAKARAESISKYLISKFSISDSIIDISLKPEQGTQVVDSNFRYVSVNFTYLVISYDVLGSQEIKEPKINTTYYLSKERTKQHQSGKHHSHIHKHKFKSKLRDLVLSATPKNACSSNSYARMMKWIAQGLGK
jgi:hypothetical protein